MKRRFRRAVKNLMTPRLNAVKFGLAGGIVSAVGVFVMTLAAVFWQGYAQHCVLILWEIYGFLGYNISVSGAFLGAVYGFIDGFLLIWIFASVYNKLVC